MSYPENVSTEETSIYCTEKFSYKTFKYFFRFFDRDTIVDRNQLNSKKHRVYENK